MCECVSRFKNNPPSLTLPLDPIACFCIPPQNLASRYNSIQQEWSTYVRDFLLSVIQHQPELTSANRHQPEPFSKIRIPDPSLNGHSKKKRRRPMPPPIKQKVMEALGDGKSVAAIAALFNLPPRAVSDLKYASGRRNAPGVVSGQ